MSRSQLAERMQRQERTIGDWERGERTPRPAERARLASALGTPTDVLFPPADPPVIAAARGVARAQSMVELRRAVIALQHEIDLLDERGAA